MLLNPNFNMGEFDKKTFNMIKKRVLINTGINRPKIKEAILLIKESLKEMINNITDEEIVYSKNHIISILIYSKDDLSRIIDNYFYTSLNELDDIDTRIKTYKNITKEELDKLNKKVSISLIYALEGGSNE